MAKWVLPEGRKPLPGEWFAERAQMQERVKELEKQLRWVLYERDATFKSMLNRAETAEAKLAKAVEELQFDYDTLGEINPSNYDHDDVCNLNDKSVEVIISIKATLAELTGGKDD